MYAKIGYQLYAEFRPEVTGWGEKAHLSLAKILDLRRGPDGRLLKQEEVKPAVDGASVAIAAEENATKVKKEEDESTPQTDATDASPASKVKRETSPAPAPDPFDDDGGISDSDLAGLV